MTAVISDEVAMFGREVVARLQRLLANDFVGAYFVGSIAIGGYVAGESDIDIVAISEHPLVEDLKHSVADVLWDVARDCPARGLEFTLYRREMAASPPEAADFEVNVNGGPRMSRTVHLYSRDEPRFWYILDRAIGHRCGIPISGPPAAEVFADAPRRILLDVMIESMRWHREHEKATLYSVLNASRAWRYAAEDILGSKLGGAAWARERWRRAALIDAAVEQRHGRAADLNGQEVDELLDYVEIALAKAS